VRMRWKKWARSVVTASRRRPSANLERARAASRGCAPRRAWRVTTSDAFR